MLKIFFSYFFILACIFINNNPVYVKASGSKNYDEYLSMIGEKAIQNGNYMSEEDYNKVAESVRLQNSNKDFIEKHVLPDKSENSSKNSYGPYPTRAGMILYTNTYSSGDSSLLGVGHIGIVEPAFYGDSDDSFYTTESFPEINSPGGVDGVWWYSNTWDYRYSDVWGLTLKKTTISQDLAAAQYYVDQYSKPYNWNYTNYKKRDSFYCSQLIYTAFLDLYGIDLGKGGIAGVVAPIDILNSDEIYIAYRS